MQQQTRQNVETRTSGVAVRKSKGRWQLAQSCPVMLEMTQSKGNNMMTVVPLVKQFQQQPGDSSEPAPQPVSTEVHVDDMHSSVFGVLRAKENDVNNGIDIVVDPPPEMNPDLSYQFNYYIWHNSEDDSGPTRPPTYILFENLFYRNFFISWDLANQTARCEQLLLPPDTVIEELDSSPDDDQIQKFVWVIPVDDNDNQQFALKTYAESHFLVFESNGGAILVPGTEVNPEVTIFMFPNNVLN
ncbi:uncharacterized protein [Dysidea avara]|uniref:uncharacterized protein n=1 Tax=Dysidea avara TaxID=196820 RepID=UPI00331E2447